MTPDDDKHVHRSRALELAAAVALLVGTVLSVLGVVLIANSAADRSRSAAAASRSAVQPGRAASSSPATPPGTPAPVPPATRTAASAPVECREDVGRFVRTVRSRVDPDKDEFGEVTDKSLVLLGRAALQHPQVLQTTRLVAFQRTRFVGAAKQWLCP